MTEISGKCPVVFALDVIGDKWTMVILRDMVFRGKRTYGAFLESYEKISTNILANRLERLENAGLIEKVPLRADGPPKAYALTEKGADMIPVLLEMIAWSARHDRYPAGTPLVSGAPEDLQERIEHDREGLIAELSRKCRMQGQAE